jgi:hypothetical protein
VLLRRVRERYGAALDYLPAARRPLLKRREFYSVMTHPGSE